MFFFKKKILIVDDDVTARKMMGIRFQKLDQYKVLTAKSGAEGIEVAQKETPHVIVLDWMMPKMSGLDVLRKLKRNSKTRDIPVLMLTAKNKMSDVEQALNLGAKDYITKPFHMGEFAKKIDKILGR